MGTTFLLRGAAREPGRGLGVSGGGWHSGEGGRSGEDGVTRLWG